MSNLTFTQKVFSANQYIDYSDKPINVFALDYDFGPNSSPDGNGNGDGVGTGYGNNHTEGSKRFSDNQKNIESFVKRVFSNNSEGMPRGVSPDALNRMVDYAKQTNENLKTEIQNITQDLKNEIESEFNSNSDVANNYINNHNADVNNIIASLPYLDPNQSAQNIKSASPKVKQTAAYSSFVGRVVRPENQFLKDAADRALSNADAFAVAGNMDASDQEVQHATKLLDNALAPNVVPSKDWKSTGEARKNLADLQAKFAKIRPSTNTQAIGQQLGLAAIDEADEAASSGDDERTKKNYELAKASLDIALGFVPVLNVGQSLYEAVTGKSVMTGADIGKLGQALAILSVATLGGSSVIKSIFKTISKAAASAAKLLGEGSRGFTEAAALAGKIGETSSKAIGEMGIDKFKEITNMPKGSRPPPETYLSKEYIDAHLSKFKDGASRFMKKNNMEFYGPAQVDGTTYILTKTEADTILASSNGDRRILEQNLGWSTGFTDGSEIVRINIPNPNEFNLRLPSGNEAGTTNLWLPGGELPTGNAEAIIDLGKANSSNWSITNVNLFN